ncbi:MAG: (Fe-S)-binding protein [Bacteroidales bacterium]
MEYHHFVLPFSIGLAALFAILMVKFTIWIVKLEPVDKRLISKNLFSVKTIEAMGEAFMEGLLHRKIFRKNPVLGYMHMSLAFGWFLLIIIGNFQAQFYTRTIVHPPHFPIFFNFFVTSPDEYLFRASFEFIMDLLLMIVLSGLMIAIAKRFYSRITGLKKTTRLKFFDKLALTTLWFIFPLRLLAESFTSGVYHNGDFLTGSLGSLFAKFLLVDKLALPAWWGYSIALGAFFVALPYSRYMHIPAEVLLIFLRKYGVRTRREFTSYSDIEVRSCSRCGICIDACQINSALGINKIQSVYFLRSIREGNVDDEKLFTCLLCGRCENICPVGIQLSDLRVTQRNKNGVENTSTYDFLAPPKYKVADVVYFAGCMTHLTPAIKKSMLKIFDIAGVNYYFMDSDKEACCGRPLIQSGHFENAAKLMEYNKKLIRQSKAKVLVTSCPICYKTFKEDYKLDIHVMHHTEYILKLAEVGILLLEKGDTKVVYHDPCELGRGLGIYEEPRKLLNKVGRLLHPAEEKENALCCGGSLGSFNLSTRQKNILRDDALVKLMKPNPDKLITACPLCKKTFAKGTNVQVMDIAELVAQSIVIPENKKPLMIHKPEPVLAECVIVHPER